MSDEIKKELEESTEEVIVNEPALDETTVEEVVEEEVKPTEDVVVDSTEESEVEEESSEVGEESVEEPSVEAPDKTAEESTDEETKEKSEDEDEVKEEPTDETPEDSPVEAGEVEPTEEEKMRAELEALRTEKEEAQEVNNFFDIMESTEAQSQEITKNITKGIEEVAKKYGIPTDISMEELEKQDPTKATMAREIMSRANAALEQAKAELNRVREVAAREIVFKRAGKLLDGYEMTEDQKAIAAETFVNILNEVGVKDLAEDLKAKVKLSVAQARMDSPVVAKVAEVAQEILDETNPKDVPTAPVEEVKTDTIVSNELSPEIETEPEKVEEVKEEVPPTPEKDLSEYMEGASTSVQKAASVTVENVLEQLEALPFRERTAFYKEHQDVIDQAMALRRKDV